MKHVKNVLKMVAPLHILPHLKLFRIMDVYQPPQEIVNMRVKHGKTWACHSNPDKPCLGSLEYLKENNLPYEVIDSKLVTEEDNWQDYTK